MIAFCVCFHILVSVYSVPRTPYSRSIENVYEFQKGEYFDLEFSFESMDGLITITSERPSWVNVEDNEEGVIFEEDISSEVVDIHVSGLFVYVMCRKGDSLIYDISDLSDVTIIGKLDTENAEGITTEGNYAYVSDGDAGIKIFDITIKSSPVLTSSLGGFWAKQSSIYGNYLFVASGSGGLKIIDVSLKTSPQLVGSDQNETLAVHINGSLCYVCNDDFGLRALSLNDPEHPVEVGSFHEVSGTYYAYKCNRISTRGHIVFFTVIDMDRFYSYDATNVRNILFESRLPSAGGEYYTDGVPFGDDYFLAVNNDITVWNMYEPTTYTSQSHYIDCSRDVGSLLGYCFGASDSYGLTMYNLTNVMNVNVTLFNFRNYVHYAVWENGDYAYVTTQNLGVKIYDIGDKNDIQLAGIFQNDGVFDPTDMKHISGDGNEYLYFCSSNVFFVFDISSNPLSPQYEGSVSLNAGDCAYFVVLGDFVYVRKNTGFGVIDVSDKQNPRCDLGFEYYDVGEYKSRRSMDYNPLDETILFNSGSDGITMLSVQNKTLPPEVVGSIDVGSTSVGSVIVDERNTQTSKTVFEIGYETPRFTVSDIVGSPTIVSIDTVFPWEGNLLCQRGNYLFFVNRFVDEFETGSKVIRIADVFDRDSPRIGTRTFRKCTKPFYEDYPDSDDWIPFSYVDDDYNLFLADSYNGLKVIQLNRKIRLYGTIPSDKKCGDEDIVLTVSDTTGQSSFPFTMRVCDDEQRNAEKDENGGNYIAAWLVPLLVVVILCPCVLFLCLGCCVVCLLCCVLTAIVCLSACVGVGSISFGVYRTRNKYDKIDRVMKLSENDSTDDIPNVKINESLFEIDYQNLKVVKQIGEGGSNSHVFHCKWKKKNVAFS